MKRESRQEKNKDRNDAQFLIVFERLASMTHGFLRSESIGWRSSDAKTFLHFKKSNPISQK